MVKFSSGGIFQCYTSKSTTQVSKFDVGMRNVGSKIVIMLPVVGT